MMKQEGKFLPWSFLLPVFVFLCASAYMSD